MTQIAIWRSTWHIVIHGLSPDAAGSTMHVAAHQ
jgi:hypothetical protein